MDIYLSSIGNLYLEDYRKQFLDFLDHSQQFIRPGDWCLDIGSSIGSTALAMAFNGAEKIICFEANKQRAEKFSENILNNKLEKKFWVYNVAAYDRDGHGILHNTLTLDNGTLDLFCSNRNECKAEEVRIVNTADLLNSSFSDENLSKIKFIKIDAEGSDAAILKNLAFLIKKNKPVIMCEWFFDEKFSAELFYTIENLIGYNAFDPKDLTRQITVKDFFDYKTGDLILLPKNEI